MKVTLGTESQTQTPFGFDTSEKPYLTHVS